METTKFTVNIRNTFHRDAPLSGADDFSAFDSQLFRLLWKYNNEKCIYKYKFSLTIYSDNVTFDKIGEVSPMNDLDFFKTRNIPLYIIHCRNRKDDFTWYQKCKGIEIYSNNIKFYKRFRNFNVVSNSILKEVKDNLMFLKSKGIIKLDVIVALSYR